MKVPVEDYKILQEFVREMTVTLRQADQFVRTLIEQPDSTDIAEKVIEHCFRCFHYIKGTGGFLRLENLVELAGALENLLLRLRSGEIPFTPQTIALIAESCLFMEKGLKLVLVEKDDDKLASSANKLEAAVIKTIGAQGTYGYMRTLDQEVQPETIELYLREADGLLKICEQEFVLWDYIATNQSRMFELCKTLNRLKQKFSDLLLNDLERIAKVMESTIDRFIKGEFFQGIYPERNFLRAVDVMRDGLMRYYQTQDTSIIGLDELLSSLHGVMRQPIGSLLVKAGLVAADAVEEALLIQKEIPVANPRRLGEVLVDMGEVTQEQINNVLERQQEKKSLFQDAEEKLQTMERNKKSTVPPGTLSPGETRVDSRKFERLVRLIKTLAEEQHRKGDQPNPVVVELLTLVRAMDTITLTSLVPRMKRTVHDLAMRYNKKVLFTIEGAGIVKGREMVGALAEPLLHLLRNGIEHGLEGKEDRALAGKNSSGKLHLLILKRDKEMWISVEDDGRGLDIEYIAKVAVQRGLIEPDKAANLTTKEVAALIFQLGLNAGGEMRVGDDKAFGMDAIKSGLKQLNGKFDVFSRPGKGTRMTLRIPLGSAPD